MSVRMAFDWVEASPSADLLAQRTMAALTIEVDGHIVTSVLDRRSQSVRKHVVVPLVTVAEWLVGNWWRIFHEVDDERPRDGFAEAHDREDALATANGAGLAALADWLTSALEQVGAVRDGADWLHVREALPARTAQRPYERGYELARAVRAELAPRSPRYEFEAAGADAVRSVDVRPPTSRIQGVVAADTPACAMQARGNGERFLQGRALGDYLDRIESQPAILSGLATDRQAQSRAFAGEFLAPSDWLGRQPPVRRGHVSADEIDELAEEVGVSAYVIRHQIANHGLATLPAW